MDRNIILGGEVFVVPPLPWKHNRKIFPLCRDLTNGELIERVRQTGAADVGEETLTTMGEVAYLACVASRPDYSREAFDELAITPPELVDAFFTIRLQTGGWKATALKEDGDESGEGEGAAKSRPSTSTESSPEPSAISAKARTTGPTP